MSYKAKKRLFNILFIVGIVVIVLVLFFPFYWLFISSLKDENELYQMPPTWVPKNPVWSHYVEIFKEYNLMTYIRNSLIVAGLTTIISIIIAAPASYALAKFKMKGKNLILSMVLSVSMFPGIVIVSPLYLAFREMGLINTYMGLVIPYLTFSLPLSIWILNTFFKQIPSELNEAAAIDGAGPFRTMIQVVMPLAAPGVFTTAILTFIAAWNEFLFALIFMTDREKYTVPVGLTMFQGAHTIRWDLIAAATVVITVPLIIMVLILQRWIVAGLTAGAIKD